LGLQTIFPAKAPHAGNILLKLIESKNRPQPVRIILDPRLVVRASSKKSARTKQAAMALITDVPAGVGERRERLNPDSLHRVDLFGRVTHVSL
jgi:riboflavin biosynthesis pyrimidine reductase